MLHPHTQQMVRKCFYDVPPPTLAQEPARCASFSPSRTAGDVTHPVKYVVDKAVAGFQAIDGAYLKLLGTAGKGQRRPLCPAQLLSVPNACTVTLTGCDPASIPSSVTIVADRSICQLKGGVARGSACACRCAASAAFSLLLRTVCEAWRSLRVAGPFSRTPWSLRAIPSAQTTRLA